MTTEVENFINNCKNIEIDGTPLTNHRDYSDIFRILTDFVSLKKGAKNAKGKDDSTYKHLKAQVKAQYPKVIEKLQALEVLLNKKVSYLQTQQKDIQTKADTAKKERQTKADEDKNILTPDIQKSQSASKDSQNLLKKLQKRWSEFLKEDGRTSAVTGGTNS